MPAKRRGLRYRARRVWAPRHPETFLSKRPMVVAYRFAAPTAFVARRFGLVKAKFMAQPNLLAGRALVPEFLQEQVTPAALGAALLRELRRSRCAAACSPKRNLPAFRTSGCAATALRAQPVQFSIMQARLLLARCP